MIAATASTWKTVALVVGLMVFAVALLVIAGGDDRGRPVPQPPDARERSSKGGRP